jgi:hypothetical protein
VAFSDYKTDLFANLRNLATRVEVLFIHRMPERSSRYKKYHIAGTKIYDNIHLVHDLSHSSKYSVGGFLRCNVITLL